MKRQGALLFILPLFLLGACRRKDDRSQAQRCLKLFHIDSVLISANSPPPRGQPIETDDVGYAAQLLRAQARPPVEFKRTKGYAGTTWGMSAAKVKELHPEAQAFEIGLLSVVEVAGKRAAEYFSFSNDRLVQADLCFYDEGRPEFTDRCLLDYPALKNRLIDQYGGPMADISDPEEKVDPMKLASWTTPGTWIDLECSRRLGKEVMLTVKYSSRDFVDARTAGPAPMRPLPSRRP